MNSNIYRHSENYVINIPFQDLAVDIYYFKKSNPKYYSITTNEKGEKIIYQDYSSAKHYHVFFYFEDIDLTIQCLLNPIDDKNSLFGLYAVSKGTRFASWQTINTNELTGKENRAIKKKFETEILNNLGKWKHKRWYN